MDPSRRIYKYDLEVTDEQIMELPAGAEFLHVGVQTGTTSTTVQLWAIVDPSADPEQRRFIIHGTGHPVARSLHASAHIGTVIAADGHVFDGGTVEEL
jgi:hypothetical protein